MPVLVVMVALVAASIVYVYRFRGEARYDSLTEYFRKGWPIFSPLNFALYMTTPPRRSSAETPAVQPLHFSAHFHALVRAEFAVGSIKRAQHENETAAPPPGR